MSLLSTQLAGTLVDDPPPTAFRRIVPVEIQVESERPFRLPFSEDFRPMPVSRTVAGRGRYTRTNGNLLTAGAGYSGFGGGFEGPGIDPSGTPPVVWWTGLDSGGGAYPIGPNGPYATGSGSAVVTRATALITGPLTTAPFRVLSDTSVGVPVPVPRFLTDPMLLRPDSRVTDSVYPEAVKLPRSEFWATWIRFALWHGAGAFLTQLDVDGAPLAGTLRLVNPYLLSCERAADDGSLRWVLGDGADTDRAVFSRDGYLSLGPVTYRIVVLRNPLSSIDPEGHSAGVFEMSPSAFQLSANVGAYGVSVFRSGVPAGFLKVTNPPNMSEEAADALRVRWMMHHGGDRRSVAVLTAGVDFTPLNFSPVDAAIGEVTRLSIADVAYAFGLSPDNLGVSLAGSATYANVRDHFQALKDFGLSPWIAAVQDVLSALLAGTAGVVVNLDGFANPPMSERVATYAAAIAAEILTPDECRAFEGLPPLPKPKPKPIPAQFLAAVPDPPPDEEPAPEPAPDPAATARARPQALRR
jgi:hypothetical protein